MVGMFSADGDGVGCDHRGRIHTGRERVGDDLGPALRRDLKKVVTEVFDQRVRLGGVSRGEKSAGDVGITARGAGGRCIQPGQAEEDEQKL